MDPGEPDVKLRQMGGPVTLQSFRFIHEDKLSWHRDLPIVFTLELFMRSQARRINAGPNKLFFESARATLKTFERALHRMYADRGWLSYFPDELADELATQLLRHSRSRTSGQLRFRPVRNPIAVPSGCASGRGYVVGRSDDRRRTCTSFLPTVYRRSPGTAYAAK